jgi:aldehyde:ferredoxin oxidoreductase
VDAIAKLLEMIVNKEGVGEMLSHGIKHAAKLWDLEDRLTLFDTLILCRFYRDLYTWEGLGQVIHAATGLSGEQADIQKIAGAVSDRVCCFNLREGLTIEDDSLSKGFYRKLTNTDQEITEYQLQIMIKEYYSLRGWSEQGEVACS